MLVGAVLPPSDEGVARNTRGRVCSPKRSRAKFGRESSFTKRSESVLRQNVKGNADIADGIRSLQQRHKSSLLEMLVSRECFLNVLVLYHDE